MSTLKRRLASQANGKLSHGPVTPAGKRNSAANAVHHGMLANSYVLNGEARERFERILDRLDTEFEPETESEQALVDMMAVARLRQMRIWGYERATIAKEIAQLQAAPESNAATRGAEGFQNLADGSSSLDLLNRDESFAYRMVSPERRNNRLRSEPRYRLSSIKS